MFNLRLFAVSAVAMVSLVAAGPVSAQVVRGEEHCVVNVKSSDVLNMRSSNSASSQVVTTLRYGQCGVVIVGNCKNSWCPVEDGHNAGWVNTRFISMVSPALHCVSGVSSDDVLNLRAYPSTNSRIVLPLDHNQCEIAFLPYVTTAWQKVRVGGHEGWVNRSYVSGDE